MLLVETVSDKCEQTVLLFEALEMGKDDCTTRLSICFGDQEVMRSHSRKENVHP